MMPLGQLDRTESLQIALYVVFTSASIGRFKWGESARASYDLNKDL
jgi:hypothetical protein